MSNQNNGRITVGYGCQNNRKVVKRFQMNILIIRALVVCGNVGAGVPIVPTIDQNTCYKTNISPYIVASDQLTYGAW
jgi:hypothetical protein